MPANVESMAYRFADRTDVPWHNLGVPVDRNETVTAEEFQERAGAAWTAEKHELWVRANKENGLREHIKSDAFALMRSDNHFILNTVSKQYQPVQNHEVFNFFHEFCNAGDMDIETGGVLDFGRTVWCLASIREGFTLAGGDRIQGFLLFSNSHGGSAGRIKFTPIRVVCANTLALAHAGNGNDFRIHHRSKFDAEIAKNALGLGHKQLEVFKEQAEFLASRDMNDVGFKAFLDALFPKKLIQHEKAVFVNEADRHWIEEVRPRNYSRAVDALLTQTGAELNRGTWWSGYNAITYLVDHLNPAQDKARALNGAWFGVGEKLKVQALTTALELAK
jgi:phage/plasmid-like protein (TIGR03299 family)